MTIKILQVEITNKMFSHNHLKKLKMINRDRIMISLHNLKPVSLKSYKILMLQIKIVQLKIYPLN